MKRAIVPILLLVLLLVIGCSAPPDAEGAGKAPPRMPGTVGVTAGQSGTGVTSGGSTGY